MEEIIEEQLNNKNHIPITIEQTEKILVQMKNSVCKIYKGGFKGTGFLCKIPFLNSKKYLYTLITNNHVLNEEDIKLNSNISFSIGDSELIKNIKISSNRQNYTNKKYDITIIEIEPEKYNILKDYFLEIDENIHQDEGSLKNYYEKQSIYLLGYPEGSKIKVSYGIMDQLNEDRINHLCNTKNGSSGSPILLLNNFKIIGLHFGCSNKFNFNYGTFIKYPIMNFLNNIEDHENNNCIKIKNIDIITENENIENISTINENVDNSIEYEKAKSSSFIINEDLTKEKLFKKFEFNKKSLKYFNKLEKRITDENQKKYAKILFEVFMTLKKNKNKSYSIGIYNNNLFKWIIKDEISTRRPLIMNFSEPPEYNLLSIIKIENTSKNFLKYIDIINIENIKINLKEEISNIYDKIKSFLDEISNIYFPPEFERACCFII